MPFVYDTASKVVAENFTTSGSIDTEVDQGFWKPGSTTARAFGIIAFRCQGKGNQLTSLSGIAFRIKVYVTTAAAGGTGITPQPVDNRAPAATTSCGMASAGVTVGTGGPNVIKAVGCGASGPGGWVAANPDAALVIDAAATTKSIDYFSSCGTAGLRFEVDAELQE